MIPQEKQPVPRKGTDFRIYGPWTVNGMKIWRLFDVGTTPWKQVGPACFSWDEARSRAEDATNGKAVAWFGNTRLVPTPYY